MSSKNARWGKKEGAPVIVLAAGSPKAHELFGGKTLAQVGDALDLGDEDVQWGYGKSPKTNEEIKSLMIKSGGIWYQIPLSRGVNAELLASPETMLNCMFRVGYLSVKEADGAPKQDEQGNVVLDETKPYMSFGRPSGIVIERMEDVFNEPVENVKQENNVENTIAQ